MQARSCGRHAWKCTSKTHTVSKEIVETILTDFSGVRYHPKFRLMTWQVMGIAVAACSLQLFTADLYDVGGASLRRPASTVIKFDPAPRQTTSSKRGYPNPMAPFPGGYRCLRRWRCPQIKIQLCRLTRFDRCIIDRSFDSAVHNQCDSVIACRETI